MVDGGGDTTAARIRQEFPSVRVLEQRNSGKSIAVNRGVAEATGNWICLLDDDDLWHRDKLRHVDAYLVEHPECLALNHPVWFFKPSGSSIETAFGFEIDFLADDLDQCHEAVRDGDPSSNDWSYLDIRGGSFERLLERNRGAFSASVLRRDIYQTAGGHLPGLTSGEDWLLFLAVARLAEWHTIPRRLAFSRQHGAQSTGNVDNIRSILAAYVVAWHGGRAFPTPLSVEQQQERLKRYGRQYREMAQGFFWAGVRRRRWDLVSIVRPLSRSLLPRRRDRLFILIPPRFTNMLWRR